MDTPQMMEIEGEVFADRMVRADGILYRRCVFTRCRIVYGGFGSFHFENCALDSCIFSMDGAASNTLAFLSYMHIILPKSLDEIIDIVKSGSLLEGSPDET